MVFGNIRDRKDFSWLEEVVGKCFDYAAANDLLSYEKGSHPIDGDELFVNIVEYETTPPENRFWEAHRQHLDLHFMLRDRSRSTLTSSTTWSRRSLWKRMTFFLWRAIPTAMLFSTPEISSFATPPMPTAPPYRWGLRPPSKRLFSKFVSTDI